MNTNFNFKIRLLGYYNFPNQTMKPEEAYVNDAEELAPLLRMSLESVKDNPCADDYIKDVIDNPAVFIFKDEENKLRQILDLEKEKDTLHKNYLELFETIISLNSKYYSETKKIADIIKQKKGDVEISAKTI